MLSPTEARTLLDLIDLGKTAGLRDRALLATMVYSFARVGAMVSMNVEDYYRQGKRWWLRLHEKGGKFHQVPAHHNAESPRTTKLNDRTSDEISLDEIERIVI